MTVGLAAPKAQMGYGEGIVQTTKVRYVMKAVAGMKIHWGNPASVQV
jgi:hypothetical protein